MYEALLSLADQYGMKVSEQRMPLTMKGLYGDGVVWINSDIPYVSKGCALAEEIGHHKTSIGDILDKTCIDSRRQEQRARRFGHGLIIPLERFIYAGQARVEGRHDVAEWLGVTEEFLQESIDFYQQKYGIYAITRDYLIHFDPLYVTKSKYWTGTNHMKFS